MWTLHSLRHEIIGILMYELRICLPAEIAEIVAEMYTNYFKYENEDSLVLFP